MVTEVEIDSAGVNVHFDMRLQVLRGNIQSRPERKIKAHGGIQDKARALSPGSSSWNLAASSSVKVEPLAG